MRKPLLSAFASYSSQQPNPFLGGRREREGIPSACGSAGACGIKRGAYFAGRSDSVTKSGEERSGDSASNRLKNRDDSFYKKAQKSEKILVPVLFLRPKFWAILCLAGERFCWLESKKKDLWILL